MLNNNSLLAARSAFSDGDVATASPARVLVKCFDRLDADLGHALTAITEKDHETTNRLLCHAQDLLSEVVGMLEPDKWEHSGALLSLYDYALRLIGAANIQKKADPVREAQTVLAELGSAFRTAAEEVDRRPAGSPAPAATPPPASAPSMFDAPAARPDDVPAQAPRPGFSVLA
ncbi:MAG: flagellar export chaperone FliS [Ilumatobacter sp.]